MSRCGWLQSAELLELADHFTIAWASAWQDDATVYLCPQFGLPRLPFIVLPSPFEPSAKVPAIDAFVGRLPVAWVDDIVSAEARDRVGGRTAATLLVEVDPAVGLTRNAVDDLLAWRLSSS